MESGSRADHGSNVTPAAAPGHESHGGVHVCQKCGWPFPNPHPNARHRRAHRKICGTLPGYSLLPQLQTGHSPVSDDDDQHSDGDLKTPSPKVLARSQFEMSSGGTGGRSNRSEDDVFSDAVDDFVDTGSAVGFQQRLEEGFKGTINKKDTATVESPEAAIGSGPGTSDKKTQMQITEVQADRVAPASAEYVPIATTDLTEREHGDESAHTGGVLTSDLNPMISGNQMNDSGEVAKNNINDLNGTYQKGNEQATPEVQVADGVLSADNATVNSSEGMSNIEKAVAVSSSTGPNFGICQLEEVHTAKMDEVPQLKEECHGKLETRSSFDDVKSTDASDDTAEVNVDAPLAPASAISSESVEGVNSMEDENAHVISVLGDIKYVGNAEAMIEGFKGEGSKILQTVNLGSDGITNEAKDSGSSIDDNCSSNPIRQLVEETLSTASEVQVLGDSPEVKGESSRLIESYPGSCAEVLSDMNPQVPSADREAEQLKRPADTTLIEVSPGLSAEVLSDMSQQVSSADREAEQLKRPADTHSGTYEVPNNEVSDVGDNSKIAIMEPHKEDNQADSEPDNIIFEKERLHGQLDRPNVSGAENSAPSSLVDQDDNQATSEPDNIIFENIRLHAQLDRPDVTGADNSAPSSLVDQNVSMKIEETVEREIEYTQTGVSEQGIQEAKSIESNFLECVSATDCQEDTIDRDLAPAAETGGSQSGSVMEKSSVESKAMLESTDVHESSAIADKLVNASERQLKEESACINMGEVSHTEANLDKLETESTLAVGGTPELVKSEDAEFPQKSSQDPVAKDSVTSSDSDSLNPLVAKDECTRDLVADASHDKPEPYGKEGDSSTEQLGTSAADFSVKSNSQTDSLETHWGSASDMPVSTAKTNAPRDSDKTDMFEAPSFMTLVEPRTAGDQKAAGASSEIHSAQNPQQSKAQAGWFPSITNVVNESQGRKKNEEIIAKVTNRSHTGGKQHTPLKSLLGEANQETKSRSSPTHVKENAAVVVSKVRDNGVRSSTTIQEEGAGRKEWNSPARYPAEIKREKRKEKGRPYWAHLVCCASVK
ncbi:unnamed protein product [Linum tenue]|uniref:C2H2-type domain-containing protein n=1 Tax=Linum tenue TaxID=586396 RepID=A0AAV0IJ88_9ROSI|nr:unnamed protein product [Linum tenue]